MLGPRCLSKLRPADLFSLAQFFVLPLFECMIEQGTGRVDEADVQGPVADTNLHLRNYATTDLRGRDHCIDNDKAVTLRSAAVCFKLPPLT